MRKTIYIVASKNRTSVKNKPKNNTGQMYLFRAKQPDAFFLYVAVYFQFFWNEFLKRVFQTFFEFVFYNKCLIQRVVVQLNIVPQLYSVLKVKTSTLTHPHDA